MKCPTCEAQGTRSIVYVGPSSSTCMSGSVYYDEDGRYHQHDPNTHTTAYNCSLGHGWVMTTNANPCWCQMMGEVVFGAIDEPVEPVPVKPPTSINDSFGRLFGYPENEK